MRKNGRFFFAVINFTAFSGVAGRSADTVSAPAVEDRELIEAVGRGGGRAVRVAVGEGRLSEMRGAITGLLEKTRGSGGGLRASRACCARDFAQVRRRVGECRSARGTCPVISAARLGEQTGLMTLNGWKSVSSRARRSRCGVCNRRKTPTTTCRFTHARSGRGAASAATGVRARRDRPSPNRRRR